MNTLNVKGNANCPAGVAFAFPLVSFLKKSLSPKKLLLEKSPCTLSSWKKKGDLTQNKSPIPMEMGHYGISSGIVMFCFRID